MCLSTVFLQKNVIFCIFCHEHQKNVKAALQGHLLDLLNGVPVLRRLLEPGNALLRKLLKLHPLLAGVRGEYQNLCPCQDPDQPVDGGRVLSIYTPHFPGGRCIYSGQKYSVFKVPSTTPLLSHISTKNAKNHVSSGEILLISTSRIAWSAGGFSCLLYLIVTLHPSI